MSRSLNAIEQEARIAVFESVNPAISNLAKNAFKAGQDSCYEHVALCALFALNVGNEKLSDSDFRKFVANSLKVLDTE